MYRFCALDMPCCMEDEHGRHVSKKGEECPKQSNGFDCLGRPIHECLSYRISKMLFIENIIAATNKACKHTDKCKASAKKPKISAKNCSAFLDSVAQLGLAYHMRPELADPKFPCFAILKDDMLYWAIQHQQVISQAANQMVVKMGKDRAKGLRDDRLSYRHYAKYAYFRSALDNFLIGPLAVNGNFLRSNIIKVAVQFHRALETPANNMSILHKSVGSADLWGTKGFGFVAPGHHQCEIYGVDSSCE